MRYEDRPGEECGVFGIYARDSRDCARLAYDALYALQHRGQESCGIVLNDQRRITYHKGMGLVGEVFSPDELRKLKGNIAVGHVRYSTTGESCIENAQPLISRYIKGTLVIAHNGNLVNADLLRREYECTGAIFQTTIDSEVLAYAFARARLYAPSIELAISSAMDRLSGAYSLVVMSPDKLVAVRDPLGIRPLTMGTLGESTVFASESCVLDAIGATFVRDLEPGEIVVADQNGIRSMRDHCGKSPSHTCIFEYIYFARPDSIIDGQSVYQARKLAGRYLAIEHPAEADIVVGVPDSGLPAAVGYAAQANLPCETGLIKNRYIGRTFIQPEQGQREDAVRIKLNALRDVVSGKRLILIDDSIVRGTTCGHIVRLLKNAGAKEVHVRISSPPFLWPCFFGTDIPDREHLVACHHTQEEICHMLDADSLGYLSLSSLEKIVPHRTDGYCDACFSGNYPMPLPDHLDPRR